MDDVGGSREAPGECKLCKREAITILGAIAWSAASSLSSDGKLIDGFEF